MDITFLTSDLDLMAYTFDRLFTYIVAKILVKCECKQIKIISILGLRHSCNIFSCTV